MVEPVTDSASLETRAEAIAIGGEAKYWQGQIELAERDHRDFIKDGKEVIRRYKGEKDKASKGSKKFNILYSNTETLKAALLARMAKPDIRRRFADRDPVARQVAEIVERAAIYTDDRYDAVRAYERGIDDYLLPGRAVVRVCYDATTAKGEGDKEYVASQELYEEYINWDDFRHEPSGTWEKVTWEAFRHRMNRAALKENFGNNLTAEQLKDIPLNWSPKPEDDRIPDAYKRAEVWEIWDKETRTRVWIVPGFSHVCRKDEDPYGLEEFFPNGEPLQSLSTNDTFIPRPEFDVYRDQADGLDEIENRIDRLTRALKRRGVYDATIAELKQLARAGDNQFIPVKNYAELSSKGGLAAAFQAEDLKVLAEVLAELHSQRDLRVQTIYEVVGIADIMRGASDPNETLGAQKIKAQFGGSRLKKRQDRVQRWIRDTLRIKAEIIAEHFEPQKLAEMTGFQLSGPVQPGQPVEGLITPEMIQLLRNDKLRSYRIDVETDSTVFDDAEQEKQQRIELLKALSEFVTAWMPVLQAQPQLLPLAFELMSFGVRTFKPGRHIEESIEQAKMQLEQAAKQPPPPDPKVQAEQAKAQAAQQKAQMDIQVAQQKAAIEMQKMQAQLQMQQADLQFMREKLGLEMQAEHQKMAIEAQRGEQEMIMDRQQMAMDAEAMERQAQMDERAADRAEDADTRKHEMGLEMMAQKAKQAKQRPSRTQ